MADVRCGVKNLPKAAAYHGRHDRVLVARSAAGDSYPIEMDEARALIERCPDCAALANEIRVLRAATARLTAPPRPRDFRLTAEQANRLRGSAIDRLLRRLAVPGLAPMRPLAGVALSVGLVMAVAGIALPTPAAGELFSTQDHGVFAPPAGVDTRATGDPAAQPAVGENSGLGGGRAEELPDGQAEPGPADELETDRLHRDALQADDPTRAALLYGGLVLAALSLGVLLLTILARQRRDPLIR